MRVASGEIVAGIVSVGAPWAVSIGSPDVLVLVGAVLSERLLVAIASLFALLVGWWMFRVEGLDFVKS